MFWTDKRKTTQIERLKTEVEAADAIIIGAGAGLSTSAGFTYSGSRFHQYFADFEKNTASMICIPAAFILIRPRKNIGRIGAGILKLTVTVMQTYPFMKFCTNL